MLQVVKGNLFSSGRQTLVNTVNCVGVMGAGVALEFKLRYPAMFVRYASLCRHGSMQVGKLWLYKPDPASGQPWVLNFPTKQHWRWPSKVEYLNLGLENFVRTYRQRGIESIAFPILGSHNGGLDESLVLNLMSDSLGACDIPIDIYQYDPNANDDLIESLKSVFRRVSMQDLAHATGIDAGRIVAAGRALERDEIHTVGRLAAAKGVGQKTLSRLVEWVRHASEPNQSGLPL